MMNILNMMICEVARWNLKRVSNQVQPFKSSLLVCRKNDVRFYLVGVLVKDRMIAATNGHSLLICDSPDVPDVEIIIPRDAIDSLIKKLDHFQKQNF